MAVPPAGFLVFVLSTTANFFDCRSRWRPQNTARSFQPWSLNPCIRQRNNTRPKIRGPRLQQKRNGASRAQIVPFHGGAETIHGGAETIHGGAETRAREAKWRWTHSASCGVHGVRSLLRVLLLTVGPGHTQSEELLEAEDYHVIYHMMRI
ncbi:hypothetical protein F5887DRAFT_922103 [Amanita rubescens]|nr:hypothetical protein F5887DRAFT_922103 [Amanita rubescens]